MFMKKIAWATFVILFLGACKGKELTLRVQNQSSMDRISEIVSVDWHAIAEGLTLAAGETIIIQDAAAQQVVYQLVYDGKDTPQSLIFLVDVPANSSVTYTVKKGIPNRFISRTYGRYVPERMDDFAWENNRIAFRMYGPALHGTNNNGVDVWVKRTDSLIINKFYYDDLNNKKSYHEDHGEGLDCYDVGHTLGAGGVAPYRNGKLWMGETYTSYKVLDNGPLRTTFVLNYDSIYVDGKNLRQTLTVSLDANSQFTKATVTCYGELDTLSLAAGIALHGGNEKLETNVDAGLIAYAEDHREAGWIYVSVLLPEGVSKIVQDDTHALALAANRIGQPFTYYFGAGWSKWGFATNEDWVSYTYEYMQKIRQPLTVTINH